MTLVARIFPGIVIAVFGGALPKTYAALTASSGGKSGKGAGLAALSTMIAPLSSMMVIVGVVTAVGGGVMYLRDLGRGYDVGIFRTPRRKPAPITESPTPAPVKAAPSPKPEPAPAPLTGRSAIVAEWQHALEKHLVVKDAYAEIVCDPLNALNHSSLFDVANAKTAAWLVAFNECQDLLFIHSPNEEAPQDEAIVTKYAAAVRTMAPLWDAALWYAEQTGTDWLPAEEKQSARRAARLLEKAADAAATESERALSLDKAADLLASIRSFKMPVEARAVMAGASRKAIERAQTTV